MAQWTKPPWLVRGFSSHVGWYMEGIRLFTSANFFQSPHPGCFRQWLESFEIHVMVIPHHVRLSWLTNISSDGCCKAIKIDWKISYGKIETNPIPCSYWTPIFQAYGGCRGSKHVEILRHRNTQKIHWWIDESPCSLYIKHLSFGSVTHRRTWWKKSVEPMIHIRRKPEGIIHWFSEVFGGIILWYPHDIPMVSHHWWSSHEPWNILLSHPIALLGKKIPDFGCVFNI